MTAGTDAAIAHDLNNLLSAISIAAQAILSRPRIGAETAADARAIRDAAERGAAVAASLRSGGSAPDGPLAPDEAIRAMLPVLLRMAGTETAITPVLDAPGCLVAIGAAELGRVIGNLVVNARHAMPAGGRVTIATTAARFDAPAPAGCFLVIDVQDTGTGIPHEALPRVFEPCFTTRAASGGSGLGLATVQDIARGAGGSVHVSRTGEGGTTIRVLLPCGGEHI